MILSIFYLLLGLVLILGGANFLTDGSSAIARRWGVSDLVIGLTVVAFGTSAPELVISVLAALNGNAGLAVGNVVGSNIFNILVIIGVTALISPLKVKGSILTNDLPLVVLSALVLLAMGNSPLLDGAPEAIVTRVDGIILLLFFTIFMRYTFNQARKSETAPQKDSAAAPGAFSPQLPMPMWQAVVWVVGGLAALIYGGDRFVAGASAIAASLGVNDAVIGLTVVAAGTSLPELATSVVAALKGKTGLAIGNVIGSNIFNIFLILGTAATIRPLPFGNIGNLDLLVLTGASLLFWLFAGVYKRRTITRLEGGILAAAYIAYIVTLIVNL